MFSLKKEFPEDTTRFVEDRVLMSIHTDTFKAMATDSPSVEHPGHIQIIPRLTLAAGFALGSGIYINIALPEETAAFMRDFQIKCGREIDD